MTRHVLAMRAFLAHAQKTCDPRDRVTVSSDKHLGSPLAVTVTQVVGDELSDINLIEEKAAIAQEEGGVPALYVFPFAALQVHRPRSCSDSDWQQMIDGAARFLDERGRQAEALGWLVDDLFAPDGLIPALCGRSVRRLATCTAVLSDGSVFERRRG